MNEISQPRDLGGTIACVSVFSLFGGAGCGFAGAFFLSKLEQFQQVGATPGALLRGLAGLAGLDLWRCGDYFINVCQKIEHGKYALIWLAALFCIGAVGGALLGWWISAPQPAIVHMGGRQLLQGAEAERHLMAEMKAEIGKGGVGIDIYPGIPISYDRETSHIAAIGGSGAGKTTMIEPIVAEAQERGDKLLIYDNKGEWTAKFHGIILAPWDKRGWAWDIGSDLDNIADARNFANCLIKDSSDPMWANAARAILTAILTFLIEERQSWDLQDVLIEAARGYQHIRGLVRKYCPESALLVESEEITKTTQGFLVNLAAYLSTVADLAAAWGGKKQEGKAISFKKWLLGDVRDHRTIIIQGNRRYLPLQQAYIQAIMEIVGGTISSPTMAESRTRKIWLVMDEVAQIGKIETLTTTLAVGRSKGVRMILGAQDLSQIREIYGDNVAEAWATNISTWILGKTSAVETADYFSNFIGKRKIRKYMPVFSGGGMGGSTADQRQDTWQEVEEWVVRPDEWSRLGNRQQKQAVELVLSTGGPAAYRLLWPWQNAPRIRPEEVPADWTQRRQPGAPADLGGGEEKENQPAVAGAAGQQIEPPQAAYQQQDQALAKPKPTPAPQPPMPAESTTIQQQPPALAGEEQAPDTDKQQQSHHNGGAEAVEVAGEATGSEALCDIAELLELTEQITKAVEIVADVGGTAPAPPAPAPLAFLGGRRQPSEEEEKEC